MSTFNRSGAERSHFCVKRKPPYPAHVRLPLPELTEDELAEVARKKASVYAHMPELVPIIKELHDAGLINGWRGVVSVDLFDGAGK